MSHSSEAARSINPNQEPLRREFLVPAIKNRIAKVVDLASPSDQQRIEGFQVTYGFDEIPSMESGSMGFFYGGIDSESGMLEFWRFYGKPDPSDEKKFIEGTGRDACQRISLRWLTAERHRKNGENDYATYHQWDEKKPNNTVDNIKTFSNSQEALDHIDRLIGQFESVVKHSA